MPTDDGTWGGIDGGSILIRVDEIRYSERAFVDGSQVRCESPAVHSRLAAPAMAALTAIGPRRYSSAACELAQSTMVTVTTLGSFNGS
jgi:hypothetical protein